MYLRETLINIGHLLLMFFFLPARLDLSFVDPGHILAALQPETEERNIPLLCQLKTQTHKRSFLRATRYDRLLKSARVVQIMKEIQTFVKI